jgi:hypothetical protein
MSDFETKVRSFEAELVEGYADPGGLVALSLSPMFAAAMGNQEHRVLISCAAALNTFALYLQTQGNKARAEVTHLKRTLEFKKAKTIGSLKSGPRETNTARAAAAYEQNPELAELEKGLADAEQKAIYYDKIPDTVLELVNVMKYEIRRREIEGSKGRF